MPRRVTRFRTKQLIALARKLKLIVVIGREQGFKSDRERKVVTLTVGSRSLFNHPEKAMQEAARELAHELGHYLAAPPGRRLRINYGISEERKRRSERSNTHWETDEAKATLIEHYLRIHFGDKTASLNPLNRTYYKKRLLRFGVDLKAIQTWWLNIGMSMVKQLTDKGARF